MKRFLLSILSCGLTLSALAQNVTFEVKAPETAGSGEQISVEFQVKTDKKVDVKDFVNPVLDGAHIIWGPSTSSSSHVQYIGGKMEHTSTQSYTYILRYDEAGEYTIDSAKVQVGDSVYTSSPRKIEITYAQAKSTSNNFFSQRTSSQTPKPQPDSNSKPKQPHNNFRNIELDGHLEAFCDEMVALGYTRSLFYSKQSHAATAEFKGRYGGEPSALYVYTTPTSNTVYAVRVLIEGLSWSNSKHKYLKFKELFEDKYGKPIKVVETFTSPYKENDGRESEALQNGQCKYLSVFNSSPADLGTIQLSIMFSGGTYVIVIDFVDRLNGDLYDKEIKESI